MDGDKWYREEMAAINFTKEPFSELRETEAVVHPRHEIPGGGWRETRESRSKCLLAKIEPTASGLLPDRWGNPRILLSFQAHKRSRRAA